MISKIIIFAVGFMLGSLFGMIVAALCAAGKDNHE